MDKKALLEMALAGLRGRGVSSLVPPPSYEGRKGDFGDEGGRNEEWIERGHRAAIAVANVEAVRALQKVDLSPTEQVRLGALVRVRCFLSIPPREQILFVLPVPCTLPRSPETDGIGVITPKSPVGASLIGKVPGDVVTADTPRGKQRLEILGVE